MPFFLLGAGWGILYDAVTAADKILRLRAVTFILDVLLMAAYACTFVLLLIALYSGQMRMPPLLFCILGLCVYLSTLHKLFVRMFDKMRIFYVKRKKRDTKK